MANILSRGYGESEDRKALNKKARKTRKYLEGPSQAVVKGHMPHV